MFISKSAMVSLNTPRNFESLSNTIVWHRPFANSIFMMALANKGWRLACAEDQHLLNGLNVHAGQLTYAAVGTALNLPFIDAREAIHV